MKVYTKTGDDGTSGLYSGERRSKADAIFEALGAVDELNAAMGTLDDTDFNREIQSRLFDIGAVIATPGRAKAKVEATKVTEVDVEELETRIDAMMAAVPKLTSFVLPRGPVHVARGACRRAERRVVDLGLGLETEALAAAAKYLNRLSDYLFALALHDDHVHGRERVPWVPRRA